MIGADGLFLTKISESEGFLELRELRSNGAIRKYQFIKKRRKHTQGCRENGGLAACLGN